MRLRALIVPTRRHLHQSMLRQLRARVARRLSTARSARLASQSGDEPFETSDNGAEQEPRE